MTEEEIISYIYKERKSNNDKKDNSRMIKLMEKLKNILFENKQTTRETNSSLDDTILVYEEFLSRNNNRR